MIRNFQPEEPSSRASYASGGGQSIDDVQGQIGLRLRAVYEAIVAEPVPSGLKDLLESMDCSNRQKP
jgi:hypothetical protein